jgi:ubiquinone/menaquinone biosynthesis C-methylase UbiE
MNGESEIRLNLGCASRPLAGYVNIDVDTLEQIRERYPGAHIPDGLPIYQYDIFNLPFGNDSVIEVRSESMLEHLSFAEERKFFLEMQRVIKPGGVLNFSVPDFEITVKQWLEARDDWRDFYRSDPEAIASCHWFGTYSYGVENRWGYLIASIFGPQNSPGQFHKNAFTVPKILAILSRLGFRELEISTFLWKGDRNPMIRCIAEKLPYKQTS